MSEYQPDKWVIVKFVKKDQAPWYKVLGSWYGGYLNGDSWRMSSGLKSIETFENHYEMHNHSGSVYKVNKNTNGMHLTSAGIWADIEIQAKENDVEVSLIDVDQFNKETNEKANEADGVRTDKPKKSRTKAKK